MDGVSWSSPRSQESFSRPTASADTLSRLASLIARADTKHPARSHRLSHLFVCQECDQTFSYTTDLLLHQELKHSLPKPHRCPSCGREFSLRSSLKLHKCEPTRCELCHGVTRPGSPCPACAPRTSDPGRMQDKCILRQPPLLDHSPYACAPCGRGFSQKQALLHHQQAGCSEPPSLSDIINGSSLPEDSPPPSEGNSARSDSSDSPEPGCSRTTSTCPLCSKTFRTKAGLQRHKETSHAEEEEGEGEEGLKTRGAKAGRGLRKRPKSRTKVLSCRSCDLVFSSTARLYMHRKEKHRREPIVWREPSSVVPRRRRGGIYPCQVCGKVFVHHLSLRAHYRRHTDPSFTAIKNGPSEECTTKDSKSSSLNRPNPVKPPLAEGKTVRAALGRPRKAPRAAEQAVSSGRRRAGPEAQGEEADGEFPCPSCPEVFPELRQLKKHVELHQSATTRRRQCSVCSSEMDAGRWPASRRQRLYHCVPCQQGFSALDSFLQHCQEHLRVRVEEDSAAG
ncbi:zinc finger protein 271 [Salarias fasciatus]|uniref:Zinc finger protein 271-like n=1 Tax=Salarias fasciatus TaxID=181472 RepID=A0A672HD82_SALFA|nr:zinc finger protein 271-like [Salarias fasciatus]XP_029975654.1 zinc finger protein 271-like [Salarias fasciatus]